MKIHKTTSDRVYFEMDSGAYGSIAKCDISKLVRAAELPETAIDGRTGNCLVELADANDSRVTDHRR